MPKPSSSEAGGFCSYLTQEILWLILIGAGLGFTWRSALGRGDWICPLELGVGGLFLVSPGQHRPAFCRPPWKLGGLLASPRRKGLGFFPGSLKGGL